MEVICIFIVLFFVISGVSMSKERENAIGARIGFIPGITLRHFQTLDVALEGILSIDGHGTYVSALAEKFIDLKLRKDGFSTYLGGGVHAGMVEHDYYNHDRDYSRELLLGISGIIGVEYKITNEPLSVSLDWKPMLHLEENFDLDASDFALSVRYIF